MKIGVITPEFPPQIGGVERYAYEFTSALARSGHKVTVFTRRHAGGEVSIPGVEVVPVLKRRYRLDRKLFASYSMDAWHVMNAAYAWAAGYVTPVVLSVHGNDFLRPYVPVGHPDLRRFIGAAAELPWIGAFEDRFGSWRTRKLLTRGLDGVTQIIANSHYTKQVLEAGFPRCRGKVSVGLVGVSDAYLNAPQHAAGKQNRFQLITVSRLSEARKNIDRVLHALASLKDQQDFSFTIVGDGTLRPQLEKLVEQLGLIDRVEFTGYLDDAELIRRLTVSDLFVLASSILPWSHEGFGIAYLEANACGTPVLASRQAGAIEAVEEGVSGLFVDEPTVAAIEEQLLRIMTGQVRLDSQACRDFAAGYTWDRVVQCALPYYSKDKNA